MASTLGAPATASPLLIAAGGIVLAGLVALLVG